MLLLLTSVICLSVSIYVEMSVLLYAYTSASCQFSNSAELLYVGNRALFIAVSVFITVCPSDIMSLFLRLGLSGSLCISVPLSVSLYVALSVYLSVCLSPCVCSVFLDSCIHSFILKTYIAPLQETTTQRRSQPSHGQKRRT